MMIVHHELLPESYLLIPAPDPAHSSELALARHLGRAVRSGKPAVWIDCRLLDTFSTQALRLLRVCCRRLRRRHMQLVLCRVSERLAQVLRQAEDGSAPAWCVVPTLDDAATQAAPHSA